MAPCGDDPPLGVPDVYRETRYPILSTVLSVDADGSMAACSPPLRWSIQDASEPELVRRWSMDDAIALGENAFSSSIVDGNSKTRTPKMVRSSKSMQVIDLVLFYD